MQKQRIFIRGTGTVRGNGFGIKQGRCIHRGHLLSHWYTYTEGSRKDNAIHALAQKIVHLAYPPRCLSCGEDTETDSMLCQTCWPDAHFIAGSVCDACGVPIKGEAEDEDLCEACHAAPPAWKKGRAVGLYEGPLRRMTLALKHGDRQDIAKHMARWMLGAGDNLIGPETTLVPVPLHWTRMIRRRFNQSVLIANAIASERAVHHIPDALQRTRATKPQKNMTREERFENQRGALQAHPKHKDQIKGKPILLIDDVMTTGATLSACAETCFDAGAESVNVLVFARVAKPD